MDLNHDDSNNGSHDLIDAKRRIVEWTSSTSLDSSIDNDIVVILDGTRQQDTRVELGSSTDLLEGLLRIFKATSDDDKRCYFLMRCIGNLIIDNDRNRILVIEDDSCLTKLGARISISDEFTAVKTLFNICNDSIAAQRACLWKGIHRELLHCVTSSGWVDEEDSEGLLLAVELLADLVLHKSEMEVDEEYDPQFVEEILKLPCIEELESDELYQAAQVISMYLPDQKFVAAVLKHNLLVRSFELLKCTSNKIAVFPDDEGRKVEQIIVKFLSDLSALPDFTSTCTEDAKLIEDLCNSCVLTENRSDHTSVAVCACILLGNLAVSDDVAVDLPKKIKLDRLCDYMCLKAYGRSNDRDNVQGQAEYLHAAAGLLRHLAMPLDNRLKYFGDQQCRQAAMALVQYPQSDVQIAGLRLYRQILSDEVERLERFIENSYLAICMRLYRETEITAVKIEVARLELGHIRTMVRVSEREVVPTFLGTPGVLESLAYCAVQTEIPMAQPEGWLGLCLAARLPSGGKLVADLFEDDKLFEALRMELQEPQDSNKVAVEDETAATPLGRRGSMPKWLQTKQRDNAVVLVHDLLKCKDVKEPIRGKLETIIKEANIQVSTITSPSG